MFPCKVPLLLATVVTTDALDATMIGTEEDVVSVDEGELLNAGCLKCSVVFT